MLNRLFLGIHWILFIAFVVIGCLFVLAMILQGTDRILRDLGRMLEFKNGIDGFLFVGAITWMPPVFLFVDWIINGKWAWFPWQRSK